MFKLILMSFHSDVLLTIYIQGPIAHEVLPAHAATIYIH